MMMISAKKAFFVFIAFPILSLNVFLYSFEKCLSQQSLSLKDSLSRTVSIPAKVEKIISLQPEISRIVVALGEGNRLVGIEQIIRWNPDIILVRGNYYPQERKVTVESVLEDQRLSSIKAVQKKEFIKLFLKNSMALSTASPDSVRF